MRLYYYQLLNDLKINTEMTVEKGSTTIALVGIDENGERNFDFLRGSDGDYSFNNIDLSKITSLNYFLFNKYVAILILHF